MRKRHKIVQIITGLQSGGAENMLLKLCSNIDREQFEIEVICLTDSGPIGDSLIANGIPVSYLGMRRGIPEIRGLRKLVSELKSKSPALIQTWLYHADLIGGLAGKFAGNIPVVWNIRNSTLDRKFSKKSTIVTVRICALLSRFLCKKIISCAESAATLHSGLGYSSDKMITIPNGFDTARFRPDQEQRIRIRNELNIPQDAIVIGLVARFDPQKDHKRFLEVAGNLQREDDRLHFLLCGDEISPDNETLCQWVQDAQIVETTHLIGRRNDIPEVTASLDIACSSSSYGEAFSNSIGEAMACGVPCVVTDVGDSSLIVGKTGIVAPPKNSEALHAAIRKMIDLGADGRLESGTAARNRIVENYSLDRIVSRYEQLYLSMLDIDYQLVP